MKVTFVIPTLNEEKGIGVTLDAIDREAFQEAGWKTEVIVVDGDSTDGTRAEARSRGAKVVVEPRRGYGRAYKTGFGLASGDVVVTGDADGTYPFERAHLFVQRLLDEDAMFLTCDRYADLGEDAMSAKHRLGNFVLSATARTLFRIRLRDSQSGMWVMRRGLLEELPYERLSDGMAFSQEIKIEAMRRFGPRAKEVPASLRRRVGEPVIASWRDGFGNLAGLVRHRLRGGDLDVPSE